MEDIQCSYDNLKNWTQIMTACEFVQKQCVNSSEVINFSEFAICTAGKNPFVLLPLVAIVSIMIFHFLGSTSENYLAPALSSLAEKFKFSEALAGVTLVALANGAPDVISAFSFIEGDPSGFNTAIGSIFGANLFTTTIVLARCIFGAQKIKVDSFGPSRDLVFFIISFFYLITLGLAGSIPTGFAIGFLTIYIVFFAFVLYGEYLAKKRKSQNQIDEFNEVDRPKLGSYNVVADFNKMGTIMDNIHSDYYSLSESNEESQVIDLSITKRYQPHSVVYKFKWVYQKTKSRLVLEYKKRKWQDQGVWEKILSVYEFPLDILRNFTVPCTDESRWNRKIAMVTPFFSAIMIILLFKISDRVWAWVTLIPISLIAGGLIWKVSHKDKIPETLITPLCILATIMAVLWIKFVADIFQDLIFMIKLVTGLPGAFLGLTIVAWGNSTNDFFVDYALARQGYGKMAVAGVYGGQLFNLLIGFGISLIGTCVKFGTLPFDLLNGDDLSKLNLTILLFVLFNFVLQLAFLCSTRFNIGKAFAFSLIGYYAIFFALVSMFSFSGNY